ncbi:hypothetical protein SUDANB95_06346 [Actinosynnema sp. ALI-1.44]
MIAMNTEALRDRLRRAVETDPEDAYFAHLHHTLDDVEDLIDTGSRKPRSPCPSTPRTSWSTRPTTWTTRRTSCPR